MLISIPPKYAVSNVVGYIKGKSAIHIARTYFGVRPGKVAYFSGCEARPGRLASHRVASPWIDGSNPRD